MDQTQFNAARFASIGLPPMNTYVNRADHRDVFNKKLRPLLEAFGKAEISFIENGDFHNLPLWIFDDYLLAEAFDKSYRSAGIHFFDLRKALKEHEKKLERAKLKAAKAVDDLISLSVDGPYKINLKQAAELIELGPVDGVVQPLEKELFFAALVCLSFHYCFNKRDFKPNFDNGSLKPIARIVAVFYGQDMAVRWLNSISSKVQRQDVAAALSKIISEHFGLWGQFLNRNG